MTIALVATLLILIVGWGGSMIGLQGVLGALPLAALAVFIVGFVWRVVYWAKSPVPFAIPTVGGQQRSLDWIKPSRLDAPWTTAAVVGRMALEVLTFRSLFRNTAAERTTINGVPVYSTDELEDYIKHHPVDVVVLTIPQSVAQDTANRLIALGIKGFWNFTNVELSSNDPSVKFENIHFADSLLALSYRIANR